MHIFLAGIPQTNGGANEEAGHTSLLWRRSGIGVSSLYFTACPCGREMVKPDPANPWVDRFAGAGIPFLAGAPGRFEDVPGLPGAMIVAFCSLHLMHHWPELDSLGCRLIWVPTMTFTRIEETVAFGTRPPAAVVFESEFQRSRIQSEYEAWGVKLFATIHGAFDPLPFRTLQRNAGEPFVVGRLARCCRTKWSPQLWPMLTAVRAAGSDVRAICQAWDESLDFHCGNPPAWAEVYPADAIPTPEFLARCHAMLGWNWGDLCENWPRVGLEAASAGVPLVVDGRGGWPEQFADAAIYCRSPEEYAGAILRLAADEPYRQSLIARGRERMLQISEPAGIAAKWRELFAQLGA
jgi:hypothetical protein